LQFHTIAVCQKNSEYFYFWVSYFLNRSMWCIQRGKMFCGTYFSLPVVLPNRNRLMCCVRFGTMWFWRSLPAFRRNMLSPSSWLKWQSWEAEGVYSVWWRNAEGKEIINSMFLQNADINLQNHTAPKLKTTLTS
jgi:hypothetical protein